MAKTVAVATPPLLPENVEIPQLSYVKWILKSLLYYEKFIDCWLFYSWSIIQVNSTWTL